MSSSPSVCGMCDIRHISKPSEVWCPDCEEGLCAECIEYHSSVKPSRGHTTIPIEEYQKLQIVTSKQSIWDSTIQIPQHGHP
jgi:hypothetical protein